MSPTLQSGKTRLLEVTFLKQLYITRIYKLVKINLGQSSSKAPTPINAVPSPASSSDGKDLPQVRVEARHKETSLPRASQSYSLVFL